MMNSCIPYDLPIGYKFVPTESELLTILACKVNGEQTPWDVKDIDLYKIQNPGQLFEGVEEDLIYIFTPFRKVCTNGKRVDRQIGDYTWKGSDKGKPIPNAENPMGWCKSFSFEHTKSKIKLGYNMKEFTLSKSKSPAKEIDCAICIIRKKVKDNRKSKISPEAYKNGCQEDELGSPLFSLPEKQENPNEDDLLANSMTDFTQLDRIQHKQFDSTSSELYLDLDSIMELASALDLSFFEDELMNPAESPELLSFKENQMEVDKFPAEDEIEIEKPVEMAPSANLQPAYHEEESDTNMQQDMNSDAEE